MWIPHLTVATIVEKDGLFLFVEEGDSNARVFNQPAGHVEEHEGILAAAYRETLEETCWEIEIYASLGISRFIAPNGYTYFRHSFAAKPLNLMQHAVRDPDIAETHWFNLDQIQAKKNQWRSSMVGDDIARYQAKQLYPLDIYHEINSKT